MAPFPSATRIWHDNTYPTLSPSRPELSAKGKTVIITGGGSGIGAETARSFAQAGVSRIALFGRREQPLLDTKASIEHKFNGVDVFTASTDITQKSEVDAAFKAFLGDQGMVHVLVSNAAVTGPMEPVQDVDPAKFIDAITANLKGSLHIAQAFLRHASPDAVVIDVNSSGAHLNFGPGFASYGVAKLGVFRLWDSVASANPQLRIFHIQPGVVDTAMNREAGGIDAVGFSDHVSLPATFNVWLASPEAKFLKSKFLWANWDVDELKHQARDIEQSAKLSIQLVGWPFGEAHDWAFQVSDAANTESAFRAK